MSKGEQSQIIILLKEQSEKFSGVIYDIGIIKNELTHIKNAQKEHKNELHEVDKKHTKNFKELSLKLEEHKKKNSEKLVEIKDIAKEGKWARIIVYGGVSLILTLVGGAVVTGIIKELIK